MIVAVPLRGQVAGKAFTIVDLEDLPLALSRKWSFGIGYANTTPKGDESSALHRQILGLNRLDSRVVHHINENPLDNRRANLMVCANKSDAQMQPHPRRDAVCRRQAESLYWDDRVREQVQRLIPEALEQAAA